MAIFNSSCAALNLDNGISAFPVPDVEDAITGQSYLARDLQLSDENSNGEAIRRDIVMNKFPTQGECFRQFGDLFWFGHLHIIPTSFALGNVLTTQEREFEIFNAYRSQAKQFSAITASNVDGFTIVGLPDDSPNLINPLETIVVTVNVSVSGPVTIAASWTFDFVSGEQLGVYFTGTRVIILQTEPQSRVLEDWEWYTDIIEAASGNEQRIAARDAPRQKFTLRFVKEDEDISYLENTLWGWQENVWGLPIWTDYTALSSAAVAGATTISVEATGERDFRAGSNELALLWVDEQTVEAVEVVSFTDTTITVSQPLLSSFSEGTLVMPLRLAKMPAGYKQSNPNYGAKIFEGIWQVTNPSNYENAASPQPIFEAGTYRGLPVWDIFTDYLVTSGNYAINESKDIRVFGDNLGKYSTMSNRKYPRNQVSGVSLAAYGRSEFYRMRAFIHALRGRQRAIWVSTGREDFTIESVDTTGSTDITVNDVNYSTLVFDSVNGPKTRQDIEIVYADGTIDRRRIINAVVTPGVREVLTLDAGISQGTDNAVRVSYLVKRRLSSDRVTLEHDWYEGESRASRLGLVDIFDE